MILFQFTELLLLSTTKISQAIIETDKELFNLRFKKATRQNLKSHEIKILKHRLAQLKTILTSRFQDSNKTKK